MSLLSNPRSALSLSSRNHHGSKLTRPQVSDRSLPLSDTSEQQLCPLFSLPAELREIIYLYTVWKWRIYGDSAMRLIVDHQNSSQPTCLQTCRRIRDEALPILYKHAWVELHIQDLKVEPQPQHWAWKSQLRRLEIVNRGIWSCEGLLPWLELIHAGQNHHETLETRDDNVPDAVEQLLQIASELRDLPWANAKSVLNRVATTIYRVAHEDDLAMSFLGPWGDALAVRDREEYERELHLLEEQNRRRLALKAAEDAWRVANT